MTSLPWNKTSGTEEINIPKAQEILDEDHYDLAKVKERILDYLAVKKLQPGMKGPILCFVGPPGVGKDLNRLIHCANDGPETVRPHLARG